MTVNERTAKLPEGSSRNNVPQFFSIFDPLPLVTLLWRRSLSFNTWKQSGVMLSANPLPPRALSNLGTGQNLVSRLWCFIIFALILFCLRRTNKYYSFEVFSKFSLHREEKSWTCLSIDVEYFSINVANQDTWFGGFTIDMSTLKSWSAVNDLRVNR